MYDYEDSIPLWLISARGEYVTSRYSHYDCCIRGMSRDAMQRLALADA